MKRLIAVVLTVAARVDERTRERVILPALSDLQFEYRGALDAARIWRARWILLCGSLLLLQVMVLGVVARGIGELRSANDGEHQAWVRTMLWTGIAGVLFTIPLAVIPMASQELLRGATMWLLLYLIPQALAISLPAGLAVGVSAGLGPQAQSTQARRRVITVGVLLSVFVGILLCWWAPISNQLYLTSIGHPRATGLNELTSIELTRLLVFGTSLGEGLARPVNPADVVLTLHFRAALTCAPLILALVASTLARHPRWGRSTKAVLACSLLVAYAILLPPIGMPSQSSLPPAVLAWTPNVMLLAAWFGCRRIQEHVRM